MFPSGNIDYEFIYSKLEYRFSNLQLLEQALTHRSRGPDNYERMEFLGDSILDFVVAESLYYQFPKLTEGKLSRMRAAIVRKNTLATVSRELELGQFLVLGEGELRSGGFDRDSILADALEALIGAIYIDGGLDPCKDFISKHFGKYLAQLEPHITYKDAKSRLQEYLQQRGIPVPNYIVVDIGGEPHKRIFEVECQIEGVERAFRATGTSRQNAEQAAAEHAIAVIMS